MRSTSVPAYSARVSTAARQAGMSAALEGYPALPLVDYCMDAVELEGAALARRQWLVAHILAQWCERLTLDIEQFPASELESLQAIRQRMIAARDALLNVRAALLGLGWLADLHPGLVDAAPRAAVERRRVPRPWQGQPRPPAAS